MTSRTAVTCFGLGGRNERNWGVRQRRICSQVGRRGGGKYIEWYVCVVDRQRLCCFPEE